MQPKNKTFGLFLLFDTVLLFSLYIGPTGRPKNPENLHVVGTNKGQVSLAWEPPKDTTNAPVDGYIIEIATGDSLNFTEFGRVDGKTCSYDATGLKEGQKYNFRLRAVNPVGTSPGGIQLDRPIVASSVGKISGYVCSTCHFSYLIDPCVGFTNYWVIIALAHFFADSKLRRQSSL